MLVPAATSIGMWCSSNQRMTPTCAMPRALPPPKATPTFGRSCAKAGEANASRRTTPADLITVFEVLVTGSPPIRWIIRGVGRGTACASADYNPPAP